MRDGEGVGGDCGCGLGAEVAVEKADTSQNVDHLEDGSSVFGLPDCQVAPVQASVMRDLPILSVGCRCPQPALSRRSSRT